jgi:hypothetical protein
VPFGYTKMKSGSAADLVFNPATPAVFFLEQFLLAIRPNAMTVIEVAECSTVGCRKWCNVANSNQFNRLQPVLAKAWRFNPAFGFGG